MNHNNKQHVFLSVSRFAVQEVHAKTISEQADAKRLNVSWSAFAVIHFISIQSQGQKTEGLLSFPRLLKKQCHVDHLFVGNWLWQCRRELAASGCCIKALHCSSTRQQQSSKPGGPNPELVPEHIVPLISLLLPQFLLDWCIILYELPLVQIGAWKKPNSQKHTVVLLPEWLKSIPCLQWSPGITM